MPSIFSHVTLFRFLLSVLFLCALFPLIAFAQNQNIGQRIADFNAEITVHEDGSFTVSESVTYDFGLNERHGIFREIPLSHPQEPRSFLYERFIDIEIDEVLVDGQAATYFDESTKQMFRLRIGDPDITITGRHTYTITYTVRGGLSYFPVDGITELNWNVTGNEWKVPIERSRVTIHDPDGLKERARSCYVGAFGENRSCVVLTNEEGVESFTTRGLAPGHGLTVAQSLTHGAIPVVINENMKPIWKFVGLFSIWLVFLIYVSVGYKMRNKVYRTTIAQYEPYRDLKPMLSGVLRDGVLHPQDITAGILYLAEQGFIKILTEKEKVLFFSVTDHQVELLRPQREATGVFDAWLLGLMFDENDSVGKRVKLSYLRHNSIKATENRKILRDIKKRAMQDLTAGGFYEPKPAHYPLSGIVFIVAAVGMFFAGMEMSSEILIFGSPFVLTLGVAFLFLWPRKTKKGFEAETHLEGFEEYLSVTGDKRFEFHNAPEKNPKTFLQYLPFAVAFGVEDEWAEVFKDITIPQPDWYDGGGNASFSASTFTEGLQGFSSSFASASSGGSSSSSSGGGGFSGGGAGGGGGGSW